MRVTVFKRRVSLDFPVLIQRFKRKQPAKKGEPVVIISGGSIK